jgi:hypothetical protein
MSRLWNKHLILKFYIFMNTNNQSNHEIEHVRVNIHWAAPMDRGIHARFHLTIE